MKKKQNQEFPEGLALPMGGDDADFTYFHLKVHYNNPELIPSKKKRISYYSQLKVLLKIHYFKISKTYKILVELGFIWQKIYAQLKSAYSF